jgi:hypothetical protein
MNIDIPQLFSNENESFKNNLTRYVQDILQISISPLLCHTCACYVKKPLWVAGSEQVYGLSDLHKHFGKRKLLLFGCC